MEEHYQVKLFGKSMAEPLRIEWSQNASDQLDIFYNYLLKEWSFKEAEKFFDQVQEFELTVAYFPKSFIQSKRMKRYRIGLVHPHISVIYEVKKNVVIVIALIDNRSSKKIR